MPNLTTLRPRIDTILLDASFSMCGIWPHAVAAINDYPRALTREFCRSETTLYVFNTDVGVKQLCSVLSTKWKPIPPQLFAPSGGTPLFDAIWAACAHTETALRRAEGAADVLVIICTDGEETSSVDHTAVDTADLIARRRAEGWQFVFLGLGHDAEAIAHSLGVPIENALNTRVAQLPATMRRIAQQRAQPTQKLLFSPDDKRNLS